MKWEFDEVFNRRRLSLNSDESILFEESLGGLFIWEERVVSKNENISILQASI